MKRVFLVSLSIAVVLAAGCWLYVEDYYHVGEAAAAMLEVENLRLEEGSLVAAAEGADTGFLFYPGGKVEYTAYAPLMERLSEEGIFCVVPKMPWNLAFLDVNAADDVIARYPEIEHWYLGGHSLGGVAAGLYAEKHPDEVEGLVLLGSYTTSDLTESGLEVLSVYGSEDGVLSREAYEKKRSNLPETAMEMVLDGGCHAYFGDYGEQKGDGTAAITREEQIERTAEAILTLMERNS